MIRVGGIVLCGGCSRRMGRPKGWLPFGEELLLPRVVRLLREAVEPIVVVAAPEQELPSLPAEVRIVRDEEKGRGPLQGIAAGLQALQAQSTPVEAAYVSSCDVPFLRPGFVRRMIGLLEERSDCSIAVPQVGEHHHPLAAVYRLGVLPHVRRLLDADRLRPFFLFESVQTRVVEAAELIGVDADFDTLRNLNTPEDYQAALRTFAQQR